MTGNLVALLHLSDSLFPIGSFSHSDGLEAATSQQHIGTPSDLEGWMTAMLSGALRRLEAPAVARAWQAFDTARFDRLSDIDHDLHALRPSSASRDASRAMGARLLTTWQRVRPHDGVQRLLSERTRFGLPVAFGIVSASSSIAARGAVEGFVYTRLAAVVSAAMRLMPIGQHEGHRLLARVLNGVPAAAEAALADTAPLTSFAPALDLAAMSQQYGHSRLFRS